MFRLASLAALVVVVSTTARAQDGGSDAVTADPRPGEPARRPIPPREFEEGVEHPVRWHPEWGNFGSWDYGLLGAALAITVGTQIVGPLRSDGDPATGAGWQGTTAFDRFVRDGLRRDDFEERGRIRDASDILLSLTVSWPFLFDGMVSAFWYHEDPELGRELALLSIEVQFVTAAIQSTANMFGSRVRPYVRDCDDPTEIPPNNGDCTGTVRYRSFFSGHASQAFAGATTSCVYHAKLDLYGGGSRDVLPCIGLVASATAVGLFRIMADMHYVTDVITGALTGTTVGLLLPLLRMRDWGGEREIAVVPTGLGVALVGRLR